MRRIIIYLLKLIKANTYIILSYRSSFVAGVVSTVLWVMLAIVSISVLTYQSPEVGGWNRYELLVVQGVYSVILGFMYTVVGENIKQLGRKIRYGDLDLVFVKPMDSQLLVSIGHFRFQHIARIIIGILLIGYALSMLHIPISGFTVVISILFFCASILVIYSIWFMFITLNFWLMDLMNLYDLLHQLTGVTRYPIEMMRFISEYLLFILMPLVVVTSVPAQILLNKFNLNLAIWSFVIAGGLFFLSRKFWFFALKYYTSASS